MKLFFIRQMMQYQMTEYYERKTDVWVFGDCAGYAYLAAALRAQTPDAPLLNVKTSRTPPNSMRVVVLPAAKRPRNARLKMIERVVFKKRGPEMELVLHGTSAAYKRLADEIDKLSVNNTHDHSHVEDDWNDWVVARSVALNIRGPLSKWTRAALGDHEYFVYQRQETFLPDSISGTTAELNPYEAPRADWQPLQLR